MRFTDHSQLANQHAVLSASQNAWTNYTVEEMDASFHSKLAAARGTELHDVAAKLIRLGLYLADTTATINQYVNDAIGFRMTPEQVLFVSMNAFGTADAISFRDNVLRIFDLKTGVIEASVRQLEVYAAFFCVEYKKDPFKLDEIDLRIYQNDEVKMYKGDPRVIAQIIEKTKSFSPRITNLRKEAFDAGI